MIAEMIAEYQTWKFQMLERFEKMKRKRRMPIVRSGEMRHVSTQATRKK